MTLYFRALLRGFTSEVSHVDWVGGVKGFVSDCYSSEKTSFLFISVTRAIVNDDGTLSRESSRGHVEASCSPRFSSRVSLFKGANVSVIVACTALGEVMSSTSTNYGRDSRPDPSLAADSDVQAPGKQNPPYPS